MPAFYSAYPTAEDVEAKLRSSGVWPEDDPNSSDPTPDQLRAQAQADLYVNFVIAEWERRVNWWPFLANGDADEEREFDSISQHGYIDLEGGVVSVHSLTIDGVVVTTDYRLEPRNADRQGKPFSEIRLTKWRRIPRDLGKIVVAAKWGYSETVPADVYGAMIDAAGRMVLTNIRNEQNISEISQDGFSKGLDIVGTLTQQDLVKLWEGAFKGVYEGYRRVVIAF